MKPSNIILFVIAFLLSACNDVEPFGIQWIDNYYLKVDNSSVTLDDNGLTTVNVNAPEDLGWSVTSSPSWIEFSKRNGTGGQKIEITCVEDNPLSTERKGSVTLRSTRYDKQVQFSVTQPGSYISLNDEEIHFMNSGGEQSVGITSNCSWKVSSRLSWVKANSLQGDRGNTSLTFSCEANDTEDSREGTISVSSLSGQIIKEIKISQEEVLLQLDETEMIFTSGRDSKPFSVKSNAQWTAQSSASWCTLNRNSGSGNNSVTVSVTANDASTSVATRTALVTVTSGKVERKIYITQSPDVRISLSVEKLEFEPESNLTSTFRVTSNSKEWAVSSNRTWCSVQPISGSNSSSVTVTVGANTNSGASYREAVITVKSGTVEKSLTVAQKAPELTVSQTGDISFEVGSESKSFTVSSNVSWSAKSSESWCTVTSTKTNVGGAVRVSVTANPNATDRTATVTVTGGGIVRSITVTQKGEAKLNVDKSHLSFSRQMGSSSVSVTANVDWSCTCSQSWCKVTKVSSSTGGTIKIEVSENPDVDSRTATIYVSGGGIEKKISVTQEGGVILEVGAPSVVSPAGGTQTINVISNVSWTCTSNMQWCVVTKLTKQIIITVEQWQGTTERTATITVKGGGVTREIKVTQSGNSDINRNDFSDDIKL